MAKIIGIIVLLGSVLGGYLLSGGKIMAIVQPFEVLIIGGAALGAFLQANPGSTFMTVLKKAPKMFSNRFTHVFYLEVLGMLYEILNKSRREGMMAIEADLEEPASSPIFSKYPAVLKDERMTAYICDYLRIMSSGNMAPTSWKACSTWSWAASRKTSSIRPTRSPASPTRCPASVSSPRCWAS